MPDWALQVLAILAGAASVYTAIRVDLATTKATAERAEKTADKAHERIDGLMEGRH